MAGPRGVSDTAKAPAPSCSVTSPRPLAWSRALIESFAAMPTSAHGPHWIDDAACPCLRRKAPSASRVLLAAE
eukprot:scaffold250610_cov30-Tisochrysis_lutea.AAC.19